MAGVVWRLLAPRWGREFWECGDALVETVCGVGCAKDVVLL